MRLPDLPENSPSSAIRPNGADHSNEPQFAFDSRGQMVPAQRPSGPQVPRRLEDLDGTAGILHVSNSMVRKMVRTGKIRPTRICRRLLFSIEEIARVIRENESK